MTSFLDRIESITLSKEDTIIRHRRNTVSDVIKMRYPDDQSVEDRISKTPHASLHARHVIALQAAQKGIDRKNRKIWRLEEAFGELEAERLGLERQIRKYEKIMDVLEESNADVVKQLLIEHGLAKARK